MNFDRILPALSALAPSIALSLGGPLAGLGVSALMDALGVDAHAPDAEKQTQDLITTLHPETALALQKADQDFKLNMQQMNLDLETLSVKDRDSARAMQIQTKDWTPRLMACAISVGFFGLLMLYAFHEIPDKNHDILVGMLGVLGTAFVQVMNFYFGSSKSSQDKDVTIKQLGLAP